MLAPTMRPQRVQSTKGYSTAGGAVAVRSEPPHLDVLLTWGKLPFGAVRHAREVVEPAHRGVLACKRDDQDTPPARDPLGGTDGRRAA